MKNRIRLLFLLLSIWTFSSVSAQNFQMNGGSSHSVVLCDNGSVWTFGNNSNYQLGRDSDFYYGDYDPNPAPISSDVFPEIQAVDAGMGNFTLALACDKTVWAWGEGAYGQLGNGSLIDDAGLACSVGTIGPGNCDRLEPIQIVGGETGNAVLTDVIYISAGYNTAYAITADNRLLAWGANNKGQLGNGVEGESSAIPVYVMNSDGTGPLENVIAIDATDYGCYALIDDDNDGVGTVYGFGDNSNHQFNADRVNKSLPVPIENEYGETLTNIIQITAGATHGLFVDTEQYLWAVGGIWGGGNQLGTYDAMYDPTRGFASLVLAGEQKTMPGFEDEKYLKNVKSISAGLCHTVAMVEYNGINYMMAWGSNSIDIGDKSVGMLGNGTNVHAMLPQFVLNEDGDDKLMYVQAISTGWTTSMAKTLNPQDGYPTTYIWGGNVKGQIGDGANYNAYYPKQFNEPQCKPADPCPVAELGPDTLYVCPSELDYGSGKTIDLHPGSVGEHYEYKWEVTMMLSNGQEVEIREDMIHNFMAQDNPVVLKAGFQGRFIVSIYNNDPDDKRCEKCPVVTDTIVIKYSEPTFDTKISHFCDTEIPFTVFNPQGKEYEVYLDADGVTPFASKTTTGEDIVFNVPIDDLARVETDDAGNAYPEDSIFYRVWVKDVSEYEGTIGSDIVHSCQTGVAIADRTAQEIRVVYDDVILSSVKIDIIDENDIGKTITPALFGSFSQSPNRNIVIHTFDPITISATGELELVLNYSLAGTDRYGRTYWLGFITDEYVALKTFDCTDFPYVNSYNQNVELSGAVNGSPTTYQSTFGAAYDMKFIFGSGYECSRTPIDIKQLCYPCKQFNPDVTLSFNEIRPDETAEVSVNLILDYPDAEQNHDVYIFKEEDYIDATQTDFQTAVFTAQAVDGAVAETFVIDYDNTGNYVLFVKDAENPLEEQCFKTQTFSVEKARFDTKFDVHYGNVDIEGATITINNTTYITDATGQIVVPDLLVGEYEYTVSAEGYIDYTGTLKVSEDVLYYPVNLTLAPQTEGLLLIVTDGTDPISGAEFTINAEIYTTDSEGKIELRDIPAGTYDYSVSHPDYLPFSNTATVVEGAVTELPVSLVLDKPVEEEVAVYACKEYTFDDQSLTETGTYTATFTAKSGVDSIVTLNLVIGDIFDFNVILSTSTITPDQTADVSFDISLYLTDQDQKHEVYILKEADFLGYGQTDLTTVVFSTQAVDGVATETFTVDYDNTGSYVALMYDADRPDDVDCFKSQTFAVEKATFDIPFTVSDEIDVVEGAEVVINNETYYTAADGTVLIPNLYIGEYDYTISVNGYLPYSGSLKVEGDVVNVPITLEEEPQTDGLVFIVTNGTDPVAGAEVTIATETYITDNEGKVGVENLVPILYFYSISHADYFTVEKTVTVVDAVITEVPVVLASNKPIEIEINEVACNEFTFNNTILEESGIYTAKFTAKSGVDSIVTLNLTIAESYEMEEIKTIQEGDVYEFGTQTLTESGVYNEMFTSVYGCDSLVELHLSVIKPYNNDVQNSGVLGTNYKISAGASHLVALSETGVVYTSGNNAYYQLGRNPEEKSSDKLLPVDGIPAITAIDAGTEAHTLAIACDGTVWSWGKNGESQLGNGMDCNESFGYCSKAVPQQVVGGETGDEFLTNVIAVAGGAKTSYAVTADGKLLAWGYNYFGQCGIGTTVPESIASPVYVLNSNGTPLEDVIAVTATRTDCYALVDDNDDGIGTVYGFGENSFSNIGLDYGSKVTTPVIIYKDNGQPLSEITMITAGETHGLFVDTEGNAWAIGGSWGGGSQLGTFTGAYNTAKGYASKVLAGEQKNIPGYEDMFYLQNVKQVSAGYAHSYALVEYNGESYVMAWGSNSVEAWDVTQTGMLGNGTVESAFVPQFVMKSPIEKLSNVQSISSGGNVGFAQTFDPKNNGFNTVVWGGNKHGTLGIIGDEDVLFPVELPLSFDISQPCPVAELGNRVLEVCSSELDVAQGKFIKLETGTFGDSYKYSWEVVVDGQPLPETYVKAYITDGGASIYATQPGVYKVKIENVNAGVDANCGTCKAVTDQVIVKFKEPSFKYKRDSFCGPELRLTLENIIGAEYAVYATETDIDPIETKAASLDYLFFDVPIEGLTPLIHDENGVEYHKDTIYYELFVEEVTGPATTIGSNLLANCSWENLDFPSYQRLEVSASSVTLKSFKIDVSEDNYASLFPLELTPVIYGEMNENGTMVPNDNNVIATGLPIIIDNPGVYEIPFNITLEGGDVPKGYWVGFTTSKVLKVKNYACADFPYGDKDVYGVQITDHFSTYKSGTGFGKGFDFNFIFPKHCGADRTPVYIKKSCPPIPDYSVTFSVKDGETLLSGATISIDGVSVTTDENGIVIFTELKNGIYEYIISAEGFETYTGSIDVYGEDVELPAIELVKITYETDLVEATCGSFQFGDDILTESGKYTKVFTSKSGADSTVNLSLTINPVYNETAEVSIKEGETYTFGTQELTEAGEYSEIFISSLGCDSTVTLTLTVLPAPIIVELVEEVCGSYAFGDNILTESGEYSEVFTAKNGADSTVNLSLTINPVYNETAEVAIKEGESHVFGTQELTEAGEYTEIFTSGLGCDSTVTLTLTVLPKEAIITDLEEVACGSYEFGDDILTESGEYSEVFTAKNGADSTVNLSLAINPVYNETAEVAIKEGETFTFGTQELAVAGDYTETFISVAGCDSTVTLTLTVLPAPVTVEIARETCGSYEFGNDILTETGRYSNVFTAKNGADSTVNLSLTINPVYNKTAELTINEGETYVFGNQELTEAGEYTEVFTSLSGCDSTVTLTLTVLPNEEIVTALKEVACGSYEFGDDILTESGKYTKVFTAKSGADSTVNLSLTINPVYNETAELTINEGETYVFGTQELTVAGDYTEVFTSVAGCDSTVTLTLAVTTIETDTEINAGDNLVISIDENASAGSVIATLPATDADGNTLTYTISNTDDFEIVDGAIVVKNPDALDAESDEAVVIDVTIETAAGTETAKVTLDITDVDEIPELELGEISTPENIEEGTVLATLPEFDEDGDKITYTLPDESAVKIENNTIVVVDPSAFDYETGNVTFELTASDGNNSITETVEVIVDNINDNAPIITLDSDEISILENLENGSVITVVKADDADGDAVMYSIEDIETLYWDSDNPGARLKTGSEIFAIDPETGELKVADETALDYETVKGFIVTLKVSDGEFSSTEKLTILLSDEDDVAIETTENTISVYPTIVTDVLSVDVSGNATVTISTVLGQIVEIAEITGSDNINVETLIKGVYNVEIANKQGLLYKCFIIKK